MITYTICKLGIFCIKIITAYDWPSDLLLDLHININLI